MIKILGLGPGAPDALTIGALKELKNNKNVYLRTEKHPTVDFLKDEGVIFKTCDYAYEESKSFDDVYKLIADDLIEIAKNEGNIIYAVPGHPLVAEKSVINLIGLCEKEGIEYSIVPAVSFVDAMMESLKVDPMEGIKIIDAFDMDNQIIDKRVSTIITQVYNPFIASEVKLKLLDGYDDETEIIYVRAAGVEGLESIRKIPLYELDRQEDIDYLTSIYIPKDLNNKKDFYDFLDIVETLRGEDGCAWDREQTHQSLKKAIIEESYEVLDAIDNEDDDALIEELGDVLLQVVFHASIGKEEGFFDIGDVIKGICNKMVYRHPHVFGDIKATKTSEVLENWEELKKEEKGFNNVSEEMKAIAKALPSTIRALKVQNKAKKVGFDWDEVEDSMKKVEEELNEIRQVYNGENKSIIEEEVGDLLFAAVNVSRMLGVDSESALEKTTRKFIKRFSYIEENLSLKGIDIKNATLKEMEELWCESKKIEKN